MRFLISVIDNQTGAATADEMAAIDAFNASLQAKGQLLLAEGITPPSAAIVIDNRVGSPAPSHTSGPLHAEAATPGADYLSGFWVITAADAEEALALASAASQACNRRVELRQLLGA